MDTQTMPYKIQAFGLTDVGHVRDNNEDFWAELPDFNFFVLADGMGGHRAGEVAAEEAVTTICSEIQRMLSSNEKPLTFEEMHGVVNLAIENTNAAVFQKSQSLPELKGMGTTL